MEATETISKAINWKSQWNQVIWSDGHSLRLPANAEPLRGLLNWVICALKWEENLWMRKNTPHMALRVSRVTALPQHSTSMERQNGFQSNKMPSAVWPYCIQKNKTVVYILHKSGRCHKKILSFFLVNFAELSISPPNRNNPSILWIWPYQDTCKSTRCSWASKIPWEN